MRIVLWSLLFLSMFFLSSCSLFTRDKGEAAEGTKDETEAVFEEGGGSEKVVEGSGEGGQVEQVAEVKKEESLKEKNMASVDGERGEDNEGDQGGKGLKTYRAEKGDTLMWVAFKLYGDYRRWKDLSRQNPGKKFLTEGMIVHYRPLAHKFVWRPNGDPYLIKRGDTLGLISSTVYGTKVRWKDIWHNNKEMIKNPNLIFAGFTLYYVK